MSRCVHFVQQLNPPVETHEPDVTFHIGNFAENGTNEFIASNEGSPLNRKNGASGDANIQTEKSKRGSRGFALGSVRYVVYLYFYFLILFIGII